MFLSLSYCVYTTNAAIVCEAAHERVKLLLRKSAEQQVNNIIALCILKHCRHGQIQFVGRRAILPALHLPVTECNVRSNQPRQHSVTRRSPDQCERPCIHSAMASCSVSPIVRTIDTCAAADAVVMVYFRLPLIVLYI